MSGHTDDRCSLKNGARAGLGRGGIMIDRADRVITLHDGAVTARLAPVHLPRPREGAHGASERGCLLEAEVGLDHLLVGEQVGCRGRSG